MIFVGGIYLAESEEKIRLNSKCGIDNASNNLQLAILDGLDLYYPDMTIVSMTPIGTYPLRYKKLFHKGAIFSHKINATDYSLGFVNIPLIKHFCIYLNLNRTLNKLLYTAAEENAKEEVLIITYGVSSPKLKAIYNLKKKIKVKTCLIVPDLPQYMSESRNLIYRFLKYIDSIFIDKYLRSIDSFVLLSEFMKEPLRIENRPWTRVEGIFNSNYNINNIPAKENFKTVLYTGNIDERYGIITLIEAFRLINDENYRLWIRGNGSTMKYIIEAEKKDSRITYFNEMSRPELMILQKKATVLINPVSSTELFTRYFFPSKTMDYMASGTPTIMTKLKSIPTEYLDYVYLAENDDSEGLKKIIVEVCSKNQSELDEFGKKASQFIMKEKNAYKQVRKIYDMISKL